MAVTVMAAAVLALFLLSSSGPLGPRLLSASPPEPVGLTLIDCATEKGAVCLDGTPAGYHLQRGAGPGSRSWLIHLEGGAWCSTVERCSNRTKSMLGSSNYMKPTQFAGSGILDSNPQLNPDFFNWNKVYVRYCDGASFSGDAEGRSQDGSTLHFRGLHIYKAVIDELMEKGLANATQEVCKGFFHLINKRVFAECLFSGTRHSLFQSVIFVYSALLTGCSAGGLATLLHCDDFSARFPREVSVKCLADAGFFLDEKDISGERSFRSVYEGVVQLQNVREVLSKDCLANKDPIECFYPAELIKNIHTPVFILNSGYDPSQIRNILVPGSSDPDKSWLSCKENIQNCNSTQIQVLDGFRNAMLNDLKVAEEKEDWGMFIDSCFTHCQALYGISWNSPISPRLRNKTIAEAVGDWYSGRKQGVKYIDCEYPCNPICSSLLPTT